MLGQWNQNRHGQPTHTPTWRNSFPYLKDCGSIRRELCRPNVRLQDNCLVSRELYELPSRASIYSNVPCAIWSGEWSSDPASTLKSSCQSQEKEEQTCYFGPPKGSREATFGGSNAPRARGSRDRRSEGPRFYPERNSGHSSDRQRARPARTRSLPPSSLCLAKSFRSTKFLFLSPCLSGPLLRGHR